MNCAETELLICDYATLSSAERFELERHLGECPACAELASDTAAALAFMGSAAEVEPPPELITRILFDAPWNKPHKAKARNWVADVLAGFLQPKFAMSMALTILSLSMLARFVMPVRQLKPADLRPSEVWAGVEDRAVRTWARTVKFYENLKVVYQIQTTLKEWQQQDADAPTADKPDEHKLPVKSRGETQSAPGAPQGTPAGSH
jgi:hypothetical protein